LASDRTLVSNQIKISVRFNKKLNIKNLQKTKHSTVRNSFPLYYLFKKSFQSPISDLTRIVSTWRTAFCLFRRRCRARCRREKREFVRCRNVGTSQPRSTRFHRDGSIEETYSLRHLKNDIKILQFNNGNRLEGKTSDCWCHTMTTAND